MKKKLLGLMILCLAITGATALAAEPIESLNGPWARVADGCDPISPQEEANLPTSGGRSDLINRLILIIEDKQYTAARYQPRYCEEGIGPEYVKPPNFARINCPGTETNTGKAAFYFSKFERDAKGLPDAVGSMVIKAEHWEGANLWGRAFDDWRFTLKNGVLHMMLPSFWGCEPKAFHAYFIRPPQQ